MKFVRLDITNKLLSREDFINQNRKLFVLPDNLPDFRLPRNRLHETDARGGLAAAMRPNKIGGTSRLPIYDVNIVGVPTISFDANEPLTVEHIKEAFCLIYRLLGTDEFDELVVPCKEGHPAFGGGIAGKLDANIRKCIEDEFNQLEKFLKSKKLPKNFPRMYLNAYNEGPLLITVQRHALSKWFNQPSTKVSVLLKGSIIGLVMALTGFSLWTLFPLTYMLPTSLNTFFPGMPLGMQIATVGSILSGMLSYFSINVLQKVFFGEKKVQVVMPNKQQSPYAIPSYTRGSVLSWVGLDFPYKTTLDELEHDLHQKLNEHLKKPAKESEMNHEQKLNAYTKLYAKQIVNKLGEDYFYDNDIEQVKKPEYVDDKMKQYLKK